MGQGEGAHQPTKGLCAPPNPSHVTWRGGGASPRAATPPGLGGKFPRGWGHPNPSRVSPGRRLLLYIHLEGPAPSLLPPIYSEGVGGQPHPSLGAALSSSNSSSSSVVLSEALTENHELHCHHAVVLLEFSLNFSSPLDGSRKEETSPGCTCVERGGAVRSALYRIFRDLNRREYDSMNRVLVTLPLSDLQGYEDALPLSRC